MALASLLSGALDDGGIGGFDNLAGGFMAGSPFAGVAASALSGLFGSAMQSSPLVSSANPVVSNMFDSSGWAINFAGTQSASSSPANSVSPTTSMPSALSAPSAGAINDYLLIGLGVLVLVWVMG